jgi:uncharacterized membrane protein YfcA
MNQILIALVILIAAFTQSLSGFGVALVSMAILPALLDIRVATPLVALVAITLEVFLLLRYRQAFNLGAVWRVALASAFGVPVGVWALARVEERIVLAGLGVVISAYALYALFNLRLPRLKHPLWAYSVGLLAGMLGGAYNTSGPPVIVYGNCQGWLPAEFKGNLQGFFFFNSFLVVANHALSHNLTTQVWSQYLWSLPALGIGMLGGVLLDRYIRPDTFRKIVLWILVLMGARLIF